MTIQEQLAVCENGWQFACDWYTPDQIERGIKGADADRAPPADVQSRAFAEWLTHEYRLAMAKGIQVGRERAYLAEHDETYLFLGEGEDGIWFVVAEKGGDQ